MEIYILRHGIAEERGSGPDAGRALTDEGREKLRRVLARARRAGVAPSLVLSSPYRRAMETAELAAEILGVKRKIVATDVLLPESAPDALWKEIRSHHEESSVLAAGHEPMLSAAVAWLLGAPAVRVEMKKGALARIDIERFGPRPEGALKWMLTARLAGGE